MSADLPKGDPKAALAFLDRLRPGGPWVLTAIPLEREGRTTTDTFMMADAERLVKWLQAQEGLKSNIYFMVNKAMQVLTSKAKKEHVEAIEYLHVDVDPKKGESPEEARPRVIKLLAEFSPLPWAMIDSGGGVQAFWKLDDPIYIGGDLTRAADLEAYNIQLARELGGDNCHNIDRIMRLPGTVNWPDAKKREKGRTARVAKVLFLAQGEERIEPLHNFTAAQRVQQEGGVGGGGGAQVVLSGNLKPINVMTDLPEAVSSRTRALIVHSDDPIEPGKYQSDSEIVFAVCCELLRAKVDDDTIASILLDKDYEISRHCLKQKRPLEYAGRQIQRAKEEVEEPRLRLMNEAHAVIADLGGKCRVISEVVDNTLDRPRSRVSKQTFDDFRNRYMHIRVEVGQTKEGVPVYKPAGKWWLEHPLRRQYDSLVFAPRRDVPNAYNLWQGFACDALTGNNHEPFLAHILDNICSGNQDHYEYVVKWMARAVQQPGEAGQVAVVLRGGQGTGKGSFISNFGGLFGRHFLQVSSAKHLVGQFNSHLRDCVVLFADEAFFAGDKQHESVLKTLITEDTLVVEGKGVDAEVAPNYTHLLMASNNSWVVPAGADERRFFILDVGENQKQNSQYFKKLREAMNNKGREHLLHFLMHLDIADFDVRKVPQTDALREQKMYSLSAEEQWWLERLMDGTITAGALDWGNAITKDRLQSDYLRYAESQRIMRRVSPTALGKFLTKQMPKGTLSSSQRMTDVEREDGHGGSRISRERAYWYSYPPLEDCRAAWDKRYGGPFDWPTEDTTRPLAGSPNDEADPY